MENNQSHNNHSHENQLNNKKEDLKIMNKLNCEYDDCSNDEISIRTNEKLKLTKTDDELSNDKLINELKDNQEKLNENKLDETKLNENKLNNQLVDNELKNKDNLDDNKLNDKSQLEDKLDDKNNQDELINEDNKLMNYDEVEGSGFPKCFDGWVIRGKTIPINKKTWNDIEIDGNDAILDCVSQIVPLLIKKPNIFPPKYEPIDKITDKSTIKTENNKELNIKKEEQQNKDDKKEEQQNKDDKKEEQQNKDDKKEEQQKDDDKKDEQQKEDNKNDELKSVKQEENKESNTMLMIPDYYKSSVGSFLMNIGLSRCKESVHKDNMRQKQRQIRKEGERQELVDELNKQTKLYNDYKGANSIFTFEQLKCTICDFKTESQSVLDGHYMIPHISNKKEYKCNYCSFATRDVRIIDYHFKSEHKKYCKIETPPQLHECSLCLDYETAQKSKATNHMAKCIKTFKENAVQQTNDSEQEYPAITPRPITQDDLKLYDITLQSLRAAVLNPSIIVPCVPGLPKQLQQQMFFLLKSQMNLQKQKINKFNKALNSPLSTASSKIQQQNNLNILNRQVQQQQHLANNILNNINPNALASLNLNDASRNNLITNLTTLNNFNQNQLNNNNLTNQFGNLNSLNNIAKSTSQLFNMLQSGVRSQNLSITNNNNQKNISSNPMNQLNNNLIKNRPTSSNHLLNNNTNIQQQKPTIKNLLQINKPTTSNNNASNSNNAKGNTFVICEICDGYIKDLELLKVHMEKMHKVKIQPKMLSSRPPLNCQKCHWRFFTDQGLERHLLGAHGLITSNMQELVDNKEDSGRCIICGKVFAVELVAHMNQVHNTTLRPAHLSYKCTVCSATFNLYRLFENHVYMVHSGSVKRNNNNETDSVAKRPKTTGVDLIKMNGV